MKKGRISGSEQSMQSHTLTYCRLKGENLSLLILGLSRISAKETFISTSLVPHRGRLASRCLIASQFLFRAPSLIRFIQFSSFQDRLGRWEDMRDDSAQIFYQLFSVGGHCEQFRCLFVCFVFCLFLDRDNSQRD